MDPARAAQSSPAAEGQPRVARPAARLLGLAGVALITVLLLGTTFAAGAAGLPSNASSPRSNAAAFAAESASADRAAPHFSPAGIEVRAASTAPTAVSSSIALSYNSVLNGNQQPINLLNLESLATIPGSPVVVGDALTGDLGNNGTVFGFDTATDSVAEGVSSAFPNPVGLAYVPPTGSVWVADAGFVPNGSGAFTSAVSVLNLSTFSFTDLLSSGNESYGIAYDPQGQQVAVTNVENDELWLYNATTFHLNHVIVTGVLPVAVAYDPVTQDLLTANELTDNLTVVDATTGSKVAPVSLAGQPSAIAIGPDGLAYVAIVNQSTVAVVNVTTASVLTYLNVGRNATSLAIDPLTNILYATGYGPTNNVTLFNLTSNHYGTTWRVSSGPHAIAISGVGDTVVLAQGGWNTIWTVLGTKSSVYNTKEYVGAEPVGEVLDPADAGLFALDYYTGNVSWINRNETRTNNTIGLLLNVGTEYATWDSRKGTFWATSTSSYHIQIVNGSSQTVSHTIASFPRYPGLVAFDPNEARVYSATVGGLNVTPTSDLTYASDPAIAAVTGTSALYYDTPNGTLYVGASTYQTAPDTGPIAIINSSLDKLVRIVQGGADTTAFALDTQNQAVYAFNAVTDNVTVINGHTNRVSGTIALPSVPNGVFVSSAVYDPVDGLIYLVMSGLNQVWLLDPTGGTIAGQIGVGDNPVSAVYDYVGGAVVVTNAYSGTLSIIRDPARYTVTFHANGLAKGVQWLIGAQNTSFVSSGATLQCFSQNTSALAWYAYAPGYFVVPSSYGNVTVQGANVDVSVQFAPVGVPTAVQFTEQGLPFNTGWNVTVTSVGKVLHPVNQTLGSKSSDVLFRVVNGTYNFTVPPLPGFIPSPKSGQFVMFATKLNITINWTESNYSVTFTESGLPTGTSWEVTLGTLVNRSTSDVITILAPNGTYRWTVQPVSGYNQTAPGTLTIQGADLAELVTFTILGLPTQVSGASGPPISGALVDLGLLALAGFLILLAVVFEVRYRRAARLEPSTGEAPAPTPAEAPDGDASPMPSTEPPDPPAE